MLYTKYIRCPCCILAGAPNWSGTLSKFTNATKARGVGEVVSGSRDVTGPLVSHFGTILQCVSSASPARVGITKKKKYTTHSTATRGLVDAIQGGAGSNNVIYVSTEQRNDHGQACGLIVGWWLPEPPSHSRSTGAVKWCSECGQSPLGRHQTDTVDT